MPLIEIPPPDAAKRIFFDGLGLPDSMRRLDFSLPLYAASPSDVMKAAGALQTKLIGWQFLTSDIKGIATAGEVPTEPDSPDGEMETSLTRGTAIDEALRASGIIREHPDVLEEPLEFRRLRISFLRIDAFWLKTLPPDNLLTENDRLYSFVAFQDELKSKLVSGTTFLSVVRRLAAQPMFRNAPPSAKRRS